MEKQLRKQQNLLVEAGIGVILFAIWNIAKVNIYLGISSFFLEELYDAAAEKGINEKGFLVFMISVVVAVLLWQLSFRLYVGLSAIADGKGKAKGYGYLILAGVLLATEIRNNWQFFGVEGILAGERMSVNLLTGFCMGAASMYVWTELLISGIRVKILRKKMKE